MNKYVLVLLFFVTAGNLSGMDSPEIPTHREILEENTRAKYSGIKELRAAFEAARAAKEKENNKEKPVKINWLSEIVGALAVVVGMME